MEREKIIKKEEIKPLLKSLKGYKKTSLIVLFFNAAIVFCECLIPFFIALLLKEIDGIAIEQTNEMIMILPYSAALLGVIFLAMILGIFSTKYSVQASLGFAKNLRRDLFYKVEDFSFSNADKFSTASLITRLTTDVMSVQQAYQIGLSVLAKAPFQLFFAIVMSFTINPKLAWIFLMMVPVATVMQLSLLFYVVPFLRKIFKKYDDLNNEVKENVESTRVVRAFVREEYENRKFKKSAREIREYFIKSDKMLALNSPIMQLLVNLSTVLISVFATYALVDIEHWSAFQGFGKGDIAALIGYGTQILACFSTFTWVVLSVFTAVEPIKRIGEVLNEQISIIPPENGIKVVDDGSVVFRNVSFSYTADCEKYVLSNINLEVAPGETVVVLGGVGASKTSLVQLIPRFYDATVGDVYVGGKNVKDYDLDVLRKRILMVLQKNTLFSGTIKENLLWGDAGATEEDMIRACKAACAHEFILSFPQGYDTYIEQGGVNLSGGQKQRLYIARAFLSNPQVLILDDTMSALDSQTERFVSQALYNELPNTTKFIITQKVFIAQNADKIIVMDGGKIVACGKHKELFQNNTIYQRIYESQMSNKDLINSVH